ncbi:MAG: copper homeostasis protein CutC [Verrucomicrobiales bacterium]|nr:copper homeostasis protein CutC [Verrucomicrobiales bacterium]
MIQIEICIDSVAGALAAERGGAHRVELCDNLFEGGTTPSAGCLRIARERCSLKIHSMVRPRGGDFLYSDLEFAVMREDVRVAKDLGADGVVFGLLTAAGEIDVPRTRELIELARPLKVTFHRAFDVCRDASRALEDLVGLGVERVLTSGQEPTCLEGMETLAALHRQAAGRIIVMPGGGLSPRNVRRIVEGTGVQEVHLGARARTESGMEFRNPRVFMGGTLRPPEFVWGSTDEAQVRTVAEVLQER